MIPTRLQGARFATIAHDASYRRYFASGDDSATIRGVLRRLYDASGNPRRSGTLDRQLEKEARSRRALAGARQRRQRAQTAAQAIAPVVQAAESRGQRLVNRKARVRALNLIRRRQLAFRAARAPVGADLTVRYQNTQKARVYATGHLASYSDGLRRAAIDFYQSLPTQWRTEGINLSIRYDFFASNATDDDGSFIYPEHIRNMGFAQRLDSDGEGLGSYYDHDMTRLDGSRTEEDRRIVSLNGLLNQVENHLLDRINLQELYSVLDTTLRGNHVRPLFFQPNHVVFSAHRRRFDSEQALIGDRHSYLFREILDQNDSGRCVWTAMLSQFENAVYKIRYTVEEMQAMTGLGNKVSMQDMSVIEDKVQITHGKKKALKEPIRIGIVVFDLRLNLRRLPEYNSREDAKTKVYIAVHNGHAYSFKNWEQARNIMRTSLSYFEACLKAAAWPEKVENAYEKAWALFRETQHMQPDRDAIEAYS